MAARFARFLESPSSPIPGIGSALQSLPIRARKIVLLICRCQSIPSRGSKLLKQIERGFPEYLVKSIVTSTGQRLSLAQIIESLKDYILDPISNGFVQMVTKVLPLEDEDVRIAVIEGYAKEIVASQERRFRPPINLRSVLGPRRSDRCAPLLLMWTSFNTETHDYIYSTLLSSLTRLTRQPYYPNYGRKLLSSGSLASFRQLEDLYGFKFTETTLGAECLYSRTGIKSTGLTEIKQAFSYHDLRPRIYFCRGASHYFDSLYIQDIFNRIIEGFECIHKFERFHISKLKLVDDNIFMVYDFTTFTTNLQSLSEFLHGLADLYKDHSITVIDTHKGPCEINLGRYIDQYATSCNDAPVYEMLQLLGDTEEGITFVSGSGLLGIPGNITGSTLWHAIVLMCIIESILAKVVGDDAGAVLPEGSTDEELVTGLKEFGDVSLPKTESWQHVDLMSEFEKEIWNYVKRQIYRLDNTIHVGADPMNFPNPSLFQVGFADKHHTTAHIEDPMLARIRCADRFVRECQKFNLKDKGQFNIDLCQKYHNYILGPVYEDDEARKELGRARFSFHQSVLNEGFEDWYRGLPPIVKIPVYAEGVSFPERWEVMKEYKVPMKKPIKMLVDLEYGTSRLAVRKVFSSEVELLRKLYDGDFVPLYYLVIFESCPTWLIEHLPIWQDDPIELDYSMPPDEDVPMELDT